MMEYKTLYDRCLQAEQRGEKTLLLRMRLPHRVPRALRHVHIFLDGSDTPTGQLIRQPLFGYATVEFYVKNLLLYLKHCQNLKYYTTIRDVVAVVDRSRNE